MKLILLMGAVLALLQPVSVQSSESQQQDRKPQSDLTQALFLGSRGLATIRHFDGLKKRGAPALNWFSRNTKSPITSFGSYDFSQSNDPLARFQGLNLGKFHLLERVPPGLSEGQFLAPSFSQNQWYTPTEIEVLRIQ